MRETRVRLSGLKRWCPSLPITPEDIHSSLSGLFQAPRDLAAATAAAKAATAARATAPEVVATWRKRISTTTASEISKGS